MCGAVGGGECLAEAEGATALTALGVAVRTSEVCIYGKLLYTPSQTAAHSTTVVVVRECYIGHYQLFEVLKTRYGRNVERAKLPCHIAVVARSGNHGGVVGSELKLWQERAPATTTACLGDAITKS